MPLSQQRLQLLPLPLPSPGCPLPPLPLPLQWQQGHQAGLQGWRQVQEALEQVPVKHMPAGRGRGAGAGQEEQVPIKQMQAVEGGKEQVGKKTR